MSIRHLIKYGLSLPLHIAAAKALGMAKNRVVGLWLAKARALETTYSDVAPTSPNDLKSSLHKKHTTDTLSVVTKKTLAHEFDLLGSGWTQMNKDQSNDDVLCSEGNLQRSNQLRALIGPNYKPIDWHLDFRSGYHWSPIVRSLTIAYGHEPGVDIKVPWELARLQHLPQLASAYSDNSSQNLVDEFQNQTLDFMAANPPLYGVNWVCTMDVAIRAANLILTYDIFRAKNAPFSPEFTNEFVAAIQAHGEHITDNLEWYPAFRGNHYLSDITSLLFIAAFLPRGPKTDCWLAFAVQEFIIECDAQFNSDGSNVEASTNYHRLSAELVVYGTALILGLGDDKKVALQAYDHQLWQVNPKLSPAPIAWTENLGPFSETHFTKLDKMARFSIDVTKPDGHVVQIGDTDNGRFFKLCPAYLEDSLEEDQQNHRHLAAAIGGLLGDEQLISYAGKKYALEAEIVTDLKGTSTPSITKQTDQAYKPAPQSISDTCTENQRLIIKIPTSGLTPIAYPGFGLYIWKSETFFLSVRCGPVGQGGNGGHAHNDQLAIELQIDGVDWIVDPGTYTYTADTKTRDLYRSHLAHATPRFRTKEPSRLDLGLFQLEDNAKAKCLKFNEHEFMGVHYGYKAPTYRQITLHSTHIEIIDSMGGPSPTDASPQTTTVTTADELRNHYGLTVPFSPGYGSQT